MKKEYTAPMLEVEAYMLDTDIAKNCNPVVNNGPKLGNHEQCTKYQDPFVIAAAEGETHVNFYDDTTEVCDCYYTGGDSGYWTS